MDDNAFDALWEAIATPVKRAFGFAAAAIGGSWTGIYATSFDSGTFHFYSYEWGEAFLSPIYLMGSKIGPFVAILFILCLIPRLPLRWLLLVVFTTASCLTMLDGNMSKLSWPIFIGINGGLAGLIWIYGMHRRIQLTREIQESRSMAYLARLEKEAAAFRDPGDNQIASDPS